MTEDERQHLEKLTSSGIAPARIVTRAHTLLKSDSNVAGSKWKYEQICDAFNVKPVTVMNVRKSFVEKGIPLKADAAFVCNMEDVLEVDKRPTTRNARWFASMRCPSSISWISENHFPCSLENLSETTMNNNAAVLQICSCSSNLWSEIATVKSQINVDALYGLK